MVAPISAHRRFYTLCIFVVLSLASIIVTPFFGLENIHPSVLWQDAPTLHNIFWNLRVPRTLAAWMIGAMLAISGMVFQAILRNPLAEPFTLGIASGSALGAAIYIQSGIVFSLWFF